MSSIRQPRCFVAIAFGHRETDALYERSIHPILRRNRVTPVIINRRDSNDDLNNQIVDQLRDSDLCIADLTHARPSVYFEAGFAQRAGPVIYTVRADHLALGQPDGARVHFDLQMKPLILWETPDDDGFQKALERRLRVSFLTEWTRAQKDVASREAARRAFSQVSVLQRLDTIRRRSMEAFKPYCLTRWAIHIADDNPTDQLERLATVPRLLVSEATIGNHRRIACVLAQESVTVGALRELRQDLLWLATYIAPIAHRSGQINVMVHVVCVALNAIPTKRVESVFTSFGRGDREGRFVNQFTTFPSPDTPVSTRTTLDCLGDVRSENELCAELKSLLSSTFGSVA